MNKWFDQEKIRKTQRTINHIFVGSICWIIGYIIGLNLTRHFLLEFTILDINGTTIVSFLFATLAVVLFEIYSEKKRAR